MSNESQRRDHFRQNYLAWAAIHHLLPASLVRELSSVIVSELSGGALSLNMLFEEALIEGDGLVQSWAIRPLETEAKLGRYLQDRIRMIVWQHDGEAATAQEQNDTIGSITPADLEAAVIIGKLDLFVATQTFKSERKPKQASLEALVSTMERSGVRIGEDGSSFSALDGLAAVEMPLKAALQKHFGDLCADADDWQGALSAYDLTLAECAKFSGEPWSSFIEALRDAATQSRSAALRTTVGAHAASLALIESLDGLKLAITPMLILNASHDAMVAGILSAEAFKWAPDRRASLLKAPMLLANHDTSSAVEYLLEERFNQASQNFWGVLRRQTALGSASESRSTKAQYARSLLTELAKADDSNRNPGTFWMAIRLLVESGQRDQAKNIRWDGATVRALLNADMVANSIEHASRHAGSKTERISVAIECFAAWAAELGNDKAELAKQMLDYLMDHAKEKDSSKWASQGISGRSVELLLEVFKKRPEVRVALTPNVSSTVKATLSRDDHWKRKSDAIKLAEVCLDVLSDEDLREIVVSILELLDPIDPSKEMWPLVQPGMEFLTAPRVAKISKTDPALGPRIVTTIIRFGLNQKSEHAHILFYLRDFELASLQEPSTAQKLMEAVQYVQAQASNINASNAIYNINALLYASKLTGRQGVDAAIESFQSVLRTATSKHRSMGLSQGYGTLSLLAERREQLDKWFNADELDKKYHLILDLVLELWKVGSEDPVVFSSFSIPPPTRPNSTIVHNWAYCSILFARLLGAQPEMMSALNKAETQEILKEPIDLARARLFAGGDGQAWDPDVLDTETVEAFYGALGQRLLQLDNLELPLRDKAVRALLKRMLKEGPRGLDAGILVAAAGSAIAIASDDQDYLNYRWRLDNEKELRLALFPMLNRLAKVHSS